MTRSTDKHMLSDWLALHGLTTDICARVLGAAPSDVCAPFHANSFADSAPPAHDPGTSWKQAVAAVRTCFPAQRDMIDDTFENTVRIRVPHRKGAPRALTLDNGPARSPMILYTFLEDPSDTLVLAHEFGHALQLRATGGRFVAPILREVCAFLSEIAQLTYASNAQPEKYALLSRAWQRDNDRYFGAAKDRLGLALTRPEAPYTYAWNYPIARYLAIEVSCRWPADRNWGFFRGEISIPTALRELGFDQAVG